MKKTSHFSLTCIGILTISLSFFLTAGKKHPKNQFPNLRAPRNCPTDGQSPSPDPDDWAPEQLLGTNWDLIKVRCNGAESTKITDANLTNDVWRMTLGFDSEGNDAVRWVDCNDNCTQLVHLTCFTHHDNSTTTGTFTYTEDDVSCSGHTDCNSHAGCTFDDTAGDTAAFSLAVANTLIITEYGWSPYDSPCGAGQGAPVSFYFAPASEKEGKKLWKKYEDSKTARNKTGKIKTKIAKKEKPKKPAKKDSLAKATKKSKKGSGSKEKKKI